MTTTYEVVAALRKTRELIEIGWTQGEWVLVAWRDRPQCYCLDGALRAVTVTDPSWRYASSVLLCPRYPLYREAEKMLEEQIGGEALVNWNDDPGRTQQEVVELLDKTIQAEEAKL